MSTIADKTDTQPPKKPQRGGARPNAGGRRPGSGRKPGVANKITADLKGMILGALQAKGAQAYLEKIADTDPKAFCTLLGKILPTQIEAPEPTETHLVVSWLNEIDGKSRGLPCAATGAEAEEL